MNYKMQTCKQWQTSRILLSVIVRDKPPTKTSDPFTACSSRSKEALNESLIDLKLQNRERERERERDVLFSIKLLPDRSLICKTKLLTKLIN